MCFIICRVSQYTPDMSGEEVEKAFSLALKMWSDATPLRFIRVNHGNADIVLSFARRGKPEKRRVQRILTSVLIHKNWMLVVVFLLCKKNCLFL